MFIFSDVDGTIYDYQLRLPQSTVEAIRTLRKNGHFVYMVTGRSKAENPPELWDIGFDGIIGGNGAYVEDHGEVLLHKTISREQCQRIFDWCEKRDIVFYEECNEGLFASPHFIERAKYPLQRYFCGKGSVMEDVRDLDVRKVLHGLTEGKELLRDGINKISFIMNSEKDYEDACRDFPDLNVGTWGGKDSEKIFGDFGIKGLDKAKAIEVLLKHHDAGFEDAIALGDGTQDVGMLEKCHIGITFSSACEEAKEVADYISDDVSNEGFAKAFRHYGLI